MKSRCKTCGEFNCNNHGFILDKTVNFKEFSGSTPPEIFVGKWNYPNVFTGILSPSIFGDNSIMSSPEIWHKNKLSISSIIQYRNQLIYSRMQSNIKKLDTKFLSVFKEVAMTHKSIAADFKLKNIVRKGSHPDFSVPLIRNVAPLKNVYLQENAPVKSKIDYLVNDTDVKSSIAILELYKSGIDNSSIIKILSAGLLGLKKNRKLVPTKWSITATDDLISKNYLKKVKLYSEISQVQVFYSEYIGNHYEFLLIPDKFSFEVIELHTNFLKSGVAWQDERIFFPRKKYAENVTGAYYANRLAFVEFLDKIKRQAQCLVIREISPQYYAPCGVGILREVSRDAFSKPPLKFNSINEALDNIQFRLKQPVSNFTIKSWILNNQNQQTKLNQFI